MTSRNYSTGPTVSQQERLLDLLEETPWLLSGNRRFRRMACAREKTRRRWSTVVAELNSFHRGCHKKIDQWKRYLQDKKMAVRRKAREIQINKNSTGGDAGLDFTLSPIEARFHALFGGNPSVAGDEETRIDPLLILPQEPQASPTGLKSEDLEPDAHEILPQEPQSGSSGLQREVLTEHSYTHQHEDTNINSQSNRRDESQMSQSSEVSEEESPAVRAEDYVSDDAEDDVAHQMKTSPRAHRSSPEVTPAPRRASSIASNEDRSRRKRVNTMRGSPSSQRVDAFNKLTRRVEALEEQRARTEHLPAENQRELTERFLTLEEQRARTEHLLTENQRELTDRFLTLEERRARTEHLHAENQRELIRALRSFTDAINLWVRRGS